MSTSKKISFLLTCLCLVGQANVSALIKSGDETNGPCKNVLVVFARGSGQNSNTRMRDLSNPKYDDIYSEASVNDTEKQTAEFFRDFSDHIGNNSSVEYVSLHNFNGRYNDYGYAAVQAQNAEFDLNHKPQHRKDVTNRYYESVRDGAEELAWFLEDQMTSCPLQQVVVGGYSQGAETVADGINILQAEFRARIAYLSLYGDPKFNPYESIVPPITGWWARGNATATHGILNARKNYIPDGIVSAGSWCQRGDNVCDAGLLNASTITNYLSDKYITHQEDQHSNIYQDKWIPKSMSEIVRAVHDRLPNTDVNTNVYVNKNDKLWNLDLAVVIDNENSMSSSLKTIKGNVGGLTGELLGDYWNSRVGVVTYNGTPTPEEPNHTYSSVVTPFTNDQTTVSHGLQSIATQAPYYGFTSDGSYYQLPEQSAQYDGIMTAINGLQWQQGAQKKIIVITNNPAASRDPSPHHWTSDQVSQAARNLDPALLNLANTSCNETWNCDQSVNDSFQSLANNSGGQINNVNLFFGTVDDLSTMLEQMEMQSVASFSGDQTGYVNYPLSFTADESYDPNSAITEYDWDCNSDGRWDDVTSDPHGSCTYSQPYDGLVTMRTWSSDDSQGAYAILPIHVTYGTPPHLDIPEVPNVTLSYQTSSVQIAWSNKYSPDTFIKISDADDNLLGYAPTSASNVDLGGIGSEVPEIHVSACADITNCSEPVKLSLDHFALEKLIDSTNDTQTFVINEAATPPSNNRATTSAATVTDAVVSSPNEQPTTTSIKSDAILGYAVTSSPNNISAINTTKLATISKPVHQIKTKTKWWLILPAALAAIVIVYIIRKLLAKRATSEAHPPQPQDHAE
jgi:hypothetical protein